MFCPNWIKMVSTSTVTNYVRTIFAVLATVLALLWGIYRFMPIGKMAPIFLSLMLALVYLDQKRLNAITNVIMAMITISCGIYLAMNFEQIVFYRMGSPTELDLFMGGVAVITLFTVTYLKVGPAIVLIAVAVLIYAFSGPWMPYLIAHRGYSIDRVINQLYLGSNGIYGLPLQVVIHYVVLFVLFGSFLKVSGAADFMVDLARGLVGRSSGGIGKVAVVSSALVGSVSGSAVANVMITGAITIPGMKKTGFEPHVAGAIEAVASTAGQLIPPVMGAAAFLMAELLEISYWNVVVVAIVPSCLYIYSTYLSVHLYAVSRRLRGEETTGTSASFVLRLLRTKGYYLAPLFVLVIFLSRGYSAYFSGMIAVLNTIFILFLREIFREGLFRGLWKGFLAIMLGIRNCGTDLASLVSAAATAGAIIGIISLTGLGTQLAEILVELSHGNLLLLSLLSALASVVLGMGVPTSAAYVVVAVLVAPAMIQLGVVPIVAHLFVLYFGCLSMITPPVAMAAYAGATIAGASLNKTGWAASRIGLTVFVIPFIFLFNPETLVGTIEYSSFQIIIALCKSILILTGLNIGVMGLLTRSIRLKQVLRVAALLGALLILFLNPVFSVFGSCLVIVVLICPFVFKGRGEVVLRDKVGEKKG
jgi:TRAP transporter 4TM/12TM fusion protein